MSLFGFILFFIAIWFYWKQWLIFRSKGKIERTINFYIRSYEIPFKRQEIDLSRDEVKQLMNRLFMNFQQNKVGKLIGKGQYGEVYQYKTGKTKIDVIKKPKCCPSNKIMECDAGENLLIMVHTSNLSAMKILFFLGRHVVEEMLLMDKFENDFIMKIKFISLDINNNHIILGLSLMENGSLLSYIKTENEIRTKHALEWAYNIAEGMHYLHSKHNAMGY